MKEWYANLVDLERDAAETLIGTSFTATNLGVTGDRYVGEEITITQSGAHWDLVGLIDEFEPPDTLRGKIVAVRPRYDEWGEDA